MATLQERAEKLVKQGSKSKKTGNKHKFVGRNNGPARQRYWTSGRLAERKIRNLMRHCGLTREQAYALWHAARKGRVKTR
jgi:hypothetical protein